MDMRVPAASVAVMILNIVLAFAVPAALCLWMKRKYGAQRRAFFIGAGVMVGFALLLEKSIQALLFASPTGAAIQENLWLYALTGGLFAGVFEETGRFVAFRFWVKKDNDANALMYGAGHGGFEWWLLLVMGSINNLLYSLMLNSGNAAMLTDGVAPEIAAQVEAAFVQLATAPTGLFLLMPMERCAALAAQLALSVLVWFAAKRGGKAALLFPLAILLHAALDAASVVLASSGMALFAVEICILLMAVWIAVLANVVWKRCRAEENRI